MLGVQTPWCHSALGHLHPVHKRGCVSRKTGQEKPQLLQKLKEQLVLLMCVITAYSSDVGWQRGQSLSSSQHSKSTACSSTLRMYLDAGCNLEDLMDSWKAKLFRQCEQLIGERERKIKKKKRRERIKKWRQ